MTEEEAKAILIDKVKPCLNGTDWEYALDMAIKALEQEPILDKIRAEVSDFEEEVFHRPNTDYSDYAAVRHCLEIIDKYKAENPTGSEIDKVDCENTKCENCNNHGYCDYESGRK